MAEVAALLAAKKIGSAALGSALSLLQSYISKEVELIAQLPSNIRRIQREFLVMHAFLKEIEAQESDDSLHAWLHELRKIAHEVEDIADRFVYLVGNKRLKERFGFCKKLIRKLPSFLDLRYVASRLKALESDLDHMSKIKDRYWVQKASESSALSLKEKEMGPKGELFGMKENISRLTNLLTREDRHDPLITISGPTGVGKSVLVSEVYETMKKEQDFVHHALVTVQSGSTSEELLKQIVKSVSGKEDNNTSALLKRIVKYVSGKEDNNMSAKEDNNLSATLLLRKILGDGKYLIILDGLEEIENVERILGSFPRNNPGSRIVIITQYKKVASKAHEDSQIEVKPLEITTAMQIFKGRVLSGDEKSTLSEEQEELAKEILGKCGNLPLAIICVANALSRVEKTKERWRIFNEEFPWHLENNKSLSPLKGAVNLSLKNLPGYLKSCLLFCSIFPMDYEFSRKRLIRLWVAEGFIEQRGTSTVEEVAEECMKELVERCMFQVVKWNGAGRIKKFKMHAAMQILVSAKSRRESFSVICNDQGNLKQYTEARHLSLHKYRMNPGDTIGLPQLRSFMALESQITPEFLSSLVSESRYLTVLDLEESEIDYIPNEIGNLFNLRYLNLRSTKVAKLPKSIRKLTNLQTLDIVFTGITELPSEVAMLKKLHHLFAATIDNESKFKFGFMSGVAAPKGIKALTELQTLCAMDASVKLLSYLRTLSHLRSLTLTKVKSFHCADLCAVMKKLQLLSSLTIISINENEELNFENLDEGLGGLQKFELQGRLSKKSCKSLVTCLAKNLNFTYLYLGWTGLKNDPLPILGQLENLATLILNNAFERDQLHFGPSGFPKLKQLVLTNMKELDVIKFDEKSAEKLEVLKLSELRNLDDVKGIEHLMSLKELPLHNLPRKAVLALKGKVSKDKLSETNDQKLAENLQPLKGTKKCFSFRKSTKTK